MKKKIVFMLTLMMLMIAVFAPVVLGDTIDVGSGLDSSKEDLGTSIETILNGLAYFIGLFAAGALIYCGFKLVVASDDKDRMDAKSHIAWVLGGIVVASMSMMIVGYVASLI